MKWCNFCEYEKPLSDFQLTRRVNRGGTVTVYPRHVCTVCRRYLTRTQERARLSDPEARARKRMYDALWRRVKRSRRVAADMPWTRLTPSEVRDLMDRALGEAAPLLTSVRRSLSSLTAAGRLRHYPADRRPSPRGGTESVWSLA